MEGDSPYLRAVSPNGADINDLMRSSHSFNKTLPPLTKGMPKGLC